LHPSSTSIKEKKLTALYFARAISQAPDQASLARAKIEACVFKTSSCVPDEIAGPAARFYSQKVTTISTEDSYHSN